MNKTIARCTIIVAAGVWILLSFIQPWVLSDQNVFLKHFVDEGLLNFLGVVVTITLASAANLHLELNKMEEKINKKVFSGTRIAIQRSVFWMISMMLLSLAMGISKPMLSHTDMAASFINGAALLIVLFNILVLADITLTVFKIEPNLNK